MAIKILVVEDSEKHQRDARECGKRLVGCEVDFATNLKDAIKLLQEFEYRGVICDVFFPDEVGESADTFRNAIVLGNRLTSMGIHHVFNTAMNHHGERIYEFVNDFLLKKQPDTFLTSGMLIESYPPDADQEADTKQWQAAFRYILLVIDALELPDGGHGEFGKAGGFCYGDRGKLTAWLEEWSQSKPFVAEVFRKYNA